MTKTGPLGCMYLISQVRSVHSQIPYRLATFHIQESSSIDLSEVVSPSGHIVLRFYALSGGDNCLLDFVALEVTPKEDTDHARRFTGPHANQQTGILGSSPRIFAQSLIQ